MGKSMLNIYEALIDFSEKEIDEMISELTREEKELISDRFGDDLHNPVNTGKFTPEKSRKYYGTLVPKMKQLLMKRKIAALEAKIAKSDNTILKEQLLSAIAAKKNNHEICERLNISTSKQCELLRELRTDGMIFSRKYYSDASIKYTLANVFSELKKLSFLTQDRTIITEPNENTLKAMVISDLHIGNELERLDMIERVFNYCIKNGIHIIFCCGDFLDGSFSSGRQKIPNLREQLEYFIKNYPSDKSIITFGVAGDHDLSIFTKAAVYLPELCLHQRPDIVIGGYNNACINIKNDEILLHHYIESGFKRDTFKPLVFEGHYHKYGFVYKNNSLMVTVPPLSDINTLMPTALELTLEFDKGYFSIARIKQICFRSEDIILNESTFDLLSNRKVDSETINNVEAYRTPVTIESAPKVLTKVQPQPSQIDKFNKRYGLSGK